MKFGEPYEEGGKWYRPVILQEDEQVAKSLSGLECRGTSGGWQAVPEGVEWVFHHLEYRIPVDPSPLKFWQFREVPWVALAPQTLADVPEKVVGRHLVMSTPQCLSATSTRPPQKPISLDDVPDGRCVERDTHSGRELFWKRGREIWRHAFDETARYHFRPDGPLTITNYIAEFRGPA